MSVEQEGEPQTVTLTCVEQTGAAFHITATPSDTVRCVEERLQQQSKIVSSERRLVYNHQQLHNDDLTLLELGLVDNSCATLSIVPQDKAEGGKFIGLKTDDQLISWDEWAED